MSALHGQLLPEYHSAGVARLSIIPGQLQQQDK